jgi:hypothetical protein
MQFAEVLPEDAPDPQQQLDDRVRALPFQVMGFQPQPALEDAGMFSLQESGDQDGASEVSVSVSYQLWRNPNDRDDPVNLRELDDAARVAIEQEPPWPRPAWLIDRVQRMRYPLLWEAVRTNWSRADLADTNVKRQLVEHTNHVLMNQYREALGLDHGPITYGRWSVTESAINPAARGWVDGVQRPAVEIDTDPFVYSIGWVMDERTTVTAVIAREHLDHIRIAFASRSTPQTDAR